MPKDVTVKDFFSTVDASQLGRREKDMRTMSLKRARICRKILRQTIHKVLLGQFQVLLIHP
jgi:hypothetical protein